MYPQSTFVPIKNPAQILKGGITMKPMLRKLTAELPQIGTYVKVHLQGSGQLQRDMETFERGSFGVLMSGVKSDVTELIHGDFRRQFIQFIMQNGTDEQAHSEVGMSSVMADDNLRFEVSVQLAFAWQVPSVIRQNAVNTLTAGCIQYAAASVSRAQMILAAALEHAGHSPHGGQQSLSLASSALEHMLAQQQAQQGATPTLVTTQSSTSDDGSTGLGQYL